MAVGVKGSWEENGKFNEDTTCEISTFLNKQNLRECDAGALALGDTLKEFL